MIEIIKELNIEVSKPNVFQAVVAKQYDMNTRFIKATFVDNGKKIYIDPNATVSVVINAYRPDGKSKGFKGEVNADDGTVTVPLHSWMLEQVGTVVCDISVIDVESGDNKKLTTTSFNLIVERAAYGGEDITSDPQYDILVELLSMAGAVSTISGELVRITDISSQEHDLSVKVSGVDNPADVVLRRCGKNLLQPPSEYLHCVAGKSVTVNGVVFTVNADGSITANGTATSTAEFVIQNASTRKYPMPAGNYVVSVGGDSEVCGPTMTVADNTGTNKQWVTPTTAHTFALEEGYYISRFAVCVLAGKTANNLIIKPMIEVGSMATEWESPSSNTTHTVGADGVAFGVKSLYPVTTLFTETIGTTVECKYDRDFGSNSKYTRWLGKKWVCVGDSITHEGVYTNSAYHSYIAEDTGIEVVNLGVRSTGFAKQAVTTDGTVVAEPYYDDSRINEIPLDADVVTIMGGINDMGAGKQIGTPTDTGTDTLCGCVNATLDAVFAHVPPTTQVGIITDPPCKDHPCNVSDNLITQYYTAMEELCKLRGVPFFDLFHCSGLRPWDDGFVGEMYPANDVSDDGTSRGLHPNEKGHALFAPRIKAFLGTLLF